LAVRREWMDLLMRRTILTLTIGLICLVFWVAKESKADKQRIVVDLMIQQKNGCADCHKGIVKTLDGKEKDITLAGEVKNISGHPPVDRKATIKGCMKCHGAGERRIRFINRIHDVHLNSPIYVGEFKQTCSGCHNMKRIKGL
jgi:hypothetical protein